MDPEDANKNENRVTNKDPNHLIGFELYSKRKTILIIIKLDQLKLCGTETISEKLIGIILERPSRECAVKIDQTN